MCAFKLGIAGTANTGKSFSRRFIPDGENVIILSPSVKAAHLKTSTGQPLKPFDFKTTKFANAQEAMEKTQCPNIHTLLAFYNKNLTPGTFKPENITGNIQLIDMIEYLPYWLEFISKHLTWVKTVIIPDFTHFISKVISTDEFIQRKAGGEAYQRFWELAALGLRNFFISIDKYRHDLMIVTEFHTEFDENLHGWDIFVPAGKMMKEKFLIPSYYDVLLFTDVKTEGEGDMERATYRFVTRPTKMYPYARTMDLWDETYIPNDLNAVLIKVREYLGI